MGGVGGDRPNPISMVVFPASLPEISGGSGFIIGVTMFSGGFSCEKTKKSTQPRLKPATHAVLVFTSVLYYRTFIT